MGDFRQRCDNAKELLVNGFSFLTESGRILGERGLFKKSPSKIYETGHGCDQAKKYSKELLINGFSFLTESGRILGGGGLFDRGAYLKD